MYMYMYACTCAFVFRLLDSHRFTVNFFLINIDIKHYICLILIHKYYILIFYNYVRVYVFIIIILKSDIRYILYIE